MAVRFDPRVRRASTFARATLSPTGIVVGAGIAGVGLALGIGLPWVIGAGLVAWGTSAWTKFKDPAFVGALVGPEFSRNLSALEPEYRKVMVSGLEAKEHFEEAVAGLPEQEADDFGGMRYRIISSLEKMYDSLLWAQRAGSFLRRARPERLRDRMDGLASDSIIVRDLRAQLEEITEISQRRDETLARSTATITGIETLAVKVGSMALDLASPGESQETTDDIRAMQAELDSYLTGLDEIQAALQTLPPQVR